MTLVVTWFVYFIELITTLQLQVSVWFIQKVLGGSVGGAAQFSRGGFGGPLIKSHVLAVDDRNWQFLSPSL